VLCVVLLRTRALLQAPALVLLLLLTRVLAAAAAATAAAAAAAAVVCLSAQVLPQRRLFRRGSGVCGAR
jgi:hypothetical protein